MSFLRLWSEYSVGFNPLWDSTPCGIRPPVGFDPLPTQRVPLWYFLRNPFWPTDPKTFLNAPSPPIYTNFEWGPRAEKNAIFRSKVFKKCLKTPFLACFFLNFACCAKNLAKIGTRTVLWESSKNQFGRPKKMSKFSKIFWKSAPPPSRKSYIGPWKLRHYLNPLITIT